MDNKKTVILNILFISVLIITVILGSIGFADLHQVNNEETVGEYDLTPLFKIILVGTIIIFLLFETSICSNLRYFLTDKNKKPLKTGFNIAMLLSTTLFFVFYFLAILYSNLAILEIFYCLLFLTSVLLRIIYFFIVKIEKA